MFRQKLNNIVSVQFKSITNVTLDDNVLQFEI